MIGSICCYGLLRWAVAVIVHTSSTTCLHECCHSWKYKRSIFSLSLSLFVMLTSDTPWSGSVTDDHRPCVTLSGVFVEGHTGIISRSFFFFQGGGYELIFWSCTHSNTTKISSFRCKRTNSSSSPRRPGGAYVTSAAVTAALSSNLTERSFQCHYPKLSIPLYCQIKPTCETNKL